MKIKVVIDDKSMSKKLISKHALSLFVESADIYLLFDLGVDAGSLAHNIRALDIDIGMVDYVVISHEHAPHYGGYSYLAEEIPLARIHIPYGSMESLGRLLERNGLRPVEMRGWLKVGEDVFIVGPFFGPPYEHFLVVDHDKGLIVVSGCMHPGVSVLEKILEKMPKDIYMLIGGLHLSNAPDDVLDSRIDMLINRYGVKYVVPLHCSGERFINKLRERYRDRLLEATGGSVITV
ncbi:MAG: MBL fold metallo-hydrolase [Desulfurococcaceae archaeon]